MTQAQISLFFYKQGIPEHESNEMVVCHACMTDKADDDNIAPHSYADSFMKLADSLSGTLVLLGFFFFNCLMKPPMSKLISVIYGNCFLQDRRFCMSSSVKTDWNCSLSTLAFAQSDVSRKPELVLGVGMPVSSLCKAPIYDQKDLGL